MLLLSFYACSQKESAIIRNPLSEPVNGLVCELDSASLMQSIAPIPDNELVAMEGKKELPVQVIRKDGKPESILVQADFSANEKKEIILKKGTPSGFPAKTQAMISVKEGGEWIWVKKKNGNEQFEYIGGDWKNVKSLRVDKRHTDHSFDIRYEGPGWESDKIGFRFYLDWRNANDIFGKKTDALILQHVGLDGFESYHELNPWGADILKVGESLGIGTIAYWADSTANRIAKTDSLYSEVTYSGLLESKITTIYHGWEYAGSKTTLISELSIRAGSYLTKEYLRSADPVDNFCTGIVKMDSTTVLKSSGTDGDWQYLATFGKQSLQNDHMGLFIFFRKKDLIQNTEDRYSHVVVLKPEGKELTYYFGGVWEQDASGVKSMEDFESFLHRQQALLNSN
jgi:hypothetical protein